MKLKSSMPPTPPCYCPWFENSGSVQNTAYGFPLLCINHKSWDCICWGTWSSFGGFYQIQIQFSFFHHRNILSLFVSTHHTCGPAQEDTPSISYATRVTKLLSYKDLPFFLTKTPLLAIFPTQKHCAAELNLHLDYWIVPLIGISVLQLK